MMFIDLHTQYQRIREAIEARNRKVLDNGQYIMGPGIKELEIQAGLLRDETGFSLRLWYRCPAHDSHGPQKKL